MAKKKKTGLAEDLIDSLLDDPKAPSRSAPQAPALPKNSVESKDLEISIDEDSNIVFDFDSQRAEPTKPLQLVTDKNNPPIKAKPLPSDPTMIMSKPAYSKPTPSEVRRAETVVQKPETKSREVNVELLDAKPPVDQTVRLPASEAIAIPERPIAVAPMAPSQPVSAADHSLRQTEGLRIAQNRIHELENELDRLRRESEKLASAGETLRRRTDELLAKSENLENRLRETQTTAEEEKKIMRAQMSAKDRENMDLRSKLEEAETRLEGNFKKIRVRERELEHRLEIVKMESQSLASQKDDMIMRLKREIDQMKFEIENSKVRSQELYNQYKEKQETARRVVRALRIALTILEGDEDPGLKKAE